MNTPAGYQQYEKSKILTASPAELTLMLYEGAIKFANIAVMAIEKGDVEKAHNNIRKVERIIEEFQVTLNHKYPVAKDFDEVYKYLQQRLLEANIKKDKVIMEEVLRHLRTMRDTWKDVMRLAKTQTK
ncbi:flagellar biosynthetic protein FliS [Firmicutes bacterium CAG:882]|jgi:flagellar protein FliS|nr:flagellar biosynthetic protein FliS [Firmicutes bacterium CAG:882]